MTLLLASSWGDMDPYFGKWREMLIEQPGGIEVRLYPDELGDAADITAALVWDPPPGLLAGLPNLKLIQSLGMGVDHIFRHDDLPEGVPVARLVDPDLVTRMSEYCVHSVLHYHRDADRYDRDQAARRWNPVSYPAASTRRVGIMGVGAIGADTAAKLKHLGFDVAGWSRTPKELPGVVGFHGADGFAGFLQRSEIVVCLLPLTAETEGILDARAFGLMPFGGGIINAARGGHVVDADLIAALDSGKLGFTKLDVFREEPLPKDHPFWGHPKIRITPHNAGITNPMTAAAEVAENYRRAMRGEPPNNIVDPARGY